MDTLANSLAAPDDTRRVIIGTAAGLADCSHPDAMRRQVPLAELTADGPRAVGSAWLCDRCGLCTGYTEAVA